MPFVPHSPPFAEQIRPKLTGAEFDRTQVALQEVTALAESASAVTTTNRPINLYDLGGDPTGSVSVNSLLSAHGGRQVDIPPGTYRIDSELPFPSAGTVWNCESGVKFQSSGFTTGSKAMAYVNYPDCAIRGNPVFDGAGLTFFGIHVTASGDRFKLDGFTVQNTYHHGIWITEADDVVLNNVRALNCGRHQASGADNPVGMYISNIAGLKMSNCHSEGSYRQGYYVASYTVGHDAQLLNITAVGNGVAHAYDAALGGSGLDFRYLRGTVANVIAHGNYGPGFIINQENAGTDVPSEDVILANINSFDNLDAGTGTAEINIHLADRVTAVNLNTRSTVANGAEQGLYVSVVNKLLVANSQFNGSTTTNQNLTIISGNDMAFRGCKFDLSGGTGKYNVTATATDGLKISNSDFRNTSGTYNVFYSGAVSNTDLRFGNTYDKALAFRIREFAGITGTGRLPGIAPVGFIGLTDTAYPGLYPVSGQLIADLQAAGFYQ